MNTLRFSIEYGNYTVSEFDFPISEEKAIQRLPGLHPSASVKLRKRTGGQARLKQMTRNCPVQLLPLTFQGVPTLRNAVWRFLERAVAEDDFNVYIFGIRDFVYIQLVDMVREENLALFPPGKAGEILKPALPASSDGRGECRHTASVPGGLKPKRKRTIARTTTRQRVFAYEGEMVRFTRARGRSEWGAFYVINRKRAERRPPLKNVTCDFCALSRGEVRDRPVSRFSCLGREYLMIANEFPIVKGQLVIFPPADSGSGDTHRIDIDSVDIEMAAKLVRRGFDDFSIDHLAGEHSAIIDAHSGKPYAVYVNSFPDAGRSVAHLQINCFPADAAPMPVWGECAWEICRDADNAADIVRISGAPYYGVTFSEAHDSQHCVMAARLIEAMKEWNYPYNLIAYPVQPAGRAGIRFVLIPRSREYSPEADQKIAGQEFLTGVILPGVLRLHKMGAVARDLAFRQTTLDCSAVLMFERHLRRLFGFPDPGDVILPAGVGRTGSGTRRPELLRNEILPRRLAVEDGGRWLDADVNPFPVVDAASLNPDYLVLVRVIRAALSHIDARVLHGHRSGAAGADFILGREAGGFVLDPGFLMGFLKPGDKVALLPHSLCDRCGDDALAYCDGIRTMGIDFHGCLTKLALVPYSCVVKVGRAFPDDSLPLVGPLAGVLHGLFKIKRELASTSEDAGAEGNVIVFGGGAMGSLCVLALKRLWPHIKVIIVEPNEIRRRMLRELAISDRVVPTVPIGGSFPISIIAANDCLATYAAVDAAARGGAILLFADVDAATVTEGVKSRIPTPETIHESHRKELVITCGKTDDLRRPYYHLVGAFGYTRDDVMKAVHELEYNSAHYSVIQNLSIAGLKVKSGRRPDGASVRSFGMSMVQALLSPAGMNDRVHGTLIAETLKSIIEI